MHRLGLILCLLVLPLLAGCGASERLIGEPKVTTDPHHAPKQKGLELVSICYNVDQNTKSEIETLARQTCKEPGSKLKVWSTDLLLNDCPVLKKARVTFQCLPPPLTP